MSDAVNCPYCGKEMAAGTIPAVRDLICWENDTLRLGEQERVVLSSAGILNSVTAKAYYCEVCQKVVVDVPDWESPLDKLDKKWTAWSEKRKEEREARAAQREEKREERAREKRRENDPWEE